MEPKGAADVRRGDRRLSLDEAVDRLRGKLEHRGHLFGRQINRNGARNRGSITRGGQANADGLGGCPWASGRNMARIFRSPVWWSSMPEITGNLSAPAWTRSRSDLGERPELLGGPLLSESATHAWTAVARGMPTPADPAWPIASSRGIGPGQTNGDLDDGYLVRQPRCKMQRPAANSHDHNAAVPGALMLPPDSHGSWPRTDTEPDIRVRDGWQEVPPRSPEMRYRVPRQASRGPDDAPFMGPGPRFPTNACGARMGTRVGPGRYRKRDRSGVAEWDRVGSRRVSAQDKESPHARWKSLTPQPKS